MPEKLVEQDVMDSLARWRKAGTVYTTPPEIALFSSHTPFELTVPVSAIKNGFYKEPVVTSASHDLALAWHPVLSSSSPLLSSLFRRYIHTQKELFTRSGLQPRDVIELNELHGHRNTYYTGAAFQAHDASLLWEFTDTILDKIMGR
jgi:hypothetical protein